MKRVEWLAYVVFGVWFLAWFVLEMIGLSSVSRRLGLRDRPWLTLSETAWAIERHFPWMRVVFAIGLGLLAVHIASPEWP